MHHSPVRAFSFPAIFALCFAATAVPAAQKPPRSDAQGSHPLAGRSGNLGDLLNDPDWLADGGQPAVGDWDGWAAPAVESEAQSPPVEPGGSAVGGRVPLNPRPMVRPAVASADAGPAIGLLIAERNRIIDGCNLFGTMEQIYRAEDVYRQRLAARGAAAGELNAAVLGRNQVYALGKAGEPHRGTADSRVRHAEGRLRAANDALQAQARVLKPLYEKVQPNLGPWLQTYVKMRAWLKPDRRDPNRAAVIAALEQGTAERKDFYEGRVLAALAQAYEGNAEAADRHLAAACEGYGRLRLFFSLLGPDCCEGYLLLGKPEMVKDWVATVKKWPVTRQTPLLCWLVASAFFQAGKDNDAKTLFDRALAKAGVWKDEDCGPLPEPLLGDAAFFYATSANVKLRDLEKAQQLLAKAPQASENWRVLRARAALLLAEGKEAEAQAALDACRERAPRVLEESLSKSDTFPPEPSGLKKD
jgi:tetratricopeptide (TPR) repeat protein